MPGIGISLVSDAIRIEKVGPERLEEIKQGKTTVNAVIKYGNNNPCENASCVAYEVKSWT
jgi:hypothetical protein